MRVPWLAASALLLLHITGCHMGLLGLAFGMSYAKGPYESGAIATELGPASMRTLGCLDVGLAITGFQNASLLEMHVGNRCDHAEPFDLSKLVIHAGSDSFVALSDPRNEITLLHIGAHERGHERIRLTNLYQVEHICFELGPIAPDAPQAHPLPLCLDLNNSDGTWSARPAVPAVQS